MKYIINLLIIFLFSCTNNKKTTNPEAKKLNDSAVSYVMNIQDYPKALSLLNQAIKIDSNYFQAYKNKLNFQGLIKPFDTFNVIGTLQNLNRLSPTNPEYLMQIGFIKIKIGDTISSINYFAKAENMYRKILDTMHSRTDGYNVHVMNHAFTLIMLGKEIEGQTLLNQIYQTTSDTIFKQIIAPGLKKTRKQLLDSLSLK